jgi:uncharacterized membrane protein
VGQSRRGGWGPSGEAVEDLLGKRHRLLGEEPEQQVGDQLVRFKNVLEMGDGVRSG